MASPLIFAGDPLEAGEGQGQLSQYYGYADTNSNTFTSATQGNLCTPYVIPALEAYAGSSYEMRCSGFGAQGSTQQTLLFQMFLGSAFGTIPTLGAVVLSASQAFAFSLVMTLTCADGINAWWGDILGAVVETSATIIPGTGGQQGIPIAATSLSAHTAAVSSAQTAAIQVKWGSATGAPTITNVKTNWRKIA